MRTAAVFLMTLASAWGATATGADLSGVPEVRDGDTLTLRGKRIRLFGVDAPEWDQLCERAGSGWRCGRAAAYALSDFIDGGPIRCRRMDTDRYGRLVAICSKDEVELNDWLVREGWALDYRHHSQGAYREAENEARRSRRGIWDSQFELPWRWRKQRR